MRRDRGDRSDTDLNAEAILVELIDDSPSGRRRLGAAFRSWTGPSADVRVFFTPDVLVGVSTEMVRGYLYDDGWTVECWIERGSRLFEELLEVEFGEGDPAGYSVSRPTEQSSMDGLMRLAIEKGSPIDEVSHLI